MNTKNLIRSFSFTGLPKRVYDLEENQIPEGEEGQLLSWDEDGNPVAIDGDSAGAVESVNGETGVVVLDAGSVGALPDDYTPTWGSVTGKPSTFPPVIGTTSTTAKAGDYQPTWADITDKPAIIASGATQAEARTAIGAGTGNSNLAIGTTASTAKAGDYTPTATEVVTALQNMSPQQIEDIQTLLGITP